MKIDSTTRFSQALVGTAAGFALFAGFSGNAAAQAKFYPDDTNCSVLPDSELVACQNQIYARQLRSGESASVTTPSDQTDIPGSNIARGTENDLGGIVPGAETDTPTALVPQSTPSLAPSGPMQLPGPEGTTVGGD